MHEHIFGPLGVTDDMVFSMNDSQESRLSAIYEYDVKRIALFPCKRDESYKFTENYESGGAGLIGTVSGYSKVIDALSCGGLGANGKEFLKENSVRDVFYKCYYRPGSEGCTDSGRGRVWIRFGCPCKI